MPYMERCYFRQQLNQHSEDPPLPSLKDFRHLQLQPHPLLQTFPEPAFVNFFPVFSLCSHTVHTLKTKHFKADLEHIHN